MLLNRCYNRTHIKHGRPRWAGHLERMSEERVVKVVLNIIVSDIVEDRIANSFVLCITLNAREVNVGNASETWCVSVENTQCIVEKSRQNSYSYNHW